MSFEDILAAVEQDPTLAAAGPPPSPQSIPSAASLADTGAEGEQPVGLGTLFSNPDIMAKVPLLLQAVRAMTEPLPGGGNCARPDTPVALLSALRPYLGGRRRTALDTMIRVSRLSGTLRALR